MSETHKGDKRRRPSTDRSSGASSRGSRPPKEKQVKENTPEPQKAKAPGGSSKQENAAPVSETHMEGTAVMSVEPNSPKTRMTTGASLDSVRVPPFVPPGLGQGQSGIIPPHAPPGFGLVPQVFGPVPQGFGQGQSGIVPPIVPPRFGQGQPSLVPPHVLPGFGQGQSGIVPPTVPPGYGQGYSVRIPLQSAPRFGQGQSGIVPPGFGQGAANAAPEREWQTVTYGQIKRSPNLDLPRTEEHAGASYETCPHVVHVPLYRRRAFDPPLGRARRKIDFSDQGSTGPSTVFPFRHWTGSKRTAQDATDSRELQQRPNSTTALLVTYDSDSSLDQSMSLSFAFESTDTSPTTPKQPPKNDADEEVPAVGGPVRLSGSDPDLFTRKMEELPGSRFHQFEAAAKWNHPRLPSYCPPYHDKVMRWRCSTISRLSRTGETPDPSSLDDLIERLRIRRGEISAQSSSLPQPLTALLRPQEGGASGAGEEDEVGCIKQSAGQQKTYSPSNSLSDLSSASDCVRAPPAAPPQDSQQAATPGPREDGLASRAEGTEGREGSKARHPVYEKRTQKSSQDADSRETIKMSVVTLGEGLPPVSPRPSGQQGGKKLGKGGKGRR